MRILWLLRHRPSVSCFDHSKSILLIIQASKHMDETELLLAQARAHKVRLSGLDGPSLTA